MPYATPEKEPVPAFHTDFTFVVAAREHLTAPDCQSGSSASHAHLLPVKLAPVRKQMSPVARSTAVGAAGSADADVGRASVAATAALTARAADARLRELGGTPRQALDPEWNIKAAHRLWSSAHDFHDWPNCERAVQDLPTPAPR